METLLLVSLLMLMLAFMLINIALMILNINEYRRINREPPITPIIPFKPRHKTAEDTEEIKRYKTILDNIDAYDGTEKNQQKVR